MKLMTCAVIVLSSLILTACSSDDKNSNETSQNIGEMIRNIDLNSKKIDTEGLAGTWLLITEETGTNNYPNDSYTDTTVTDRVSYGRINYISDTQVVINDFYHFEQQIFTISGNKLVAEDLGNTSWDLSIIDDSEMEGTSSYVFSSKSAERAHRMVKISGDSSVSLAEVSYNLTIDGENSSGSTELSGFSESYTVWTENVEGGSETHLTSSVAAYLSNDMYLYIYTESSNGDEGYQLDDGKGRYIFNDLEGPDVLTKNTSPNSGHATISDNNAYDNYDIGTNLDVEFIINYTFNF